MRRTKDAKVQLWGIIGTVVMMCVMFLCFSLTSLAAEGTVTAASAKIRKEASTSSDMVAGAVSGEVYTITNEVTGADGMVWYQISYEQDKLGYIRSDLMRKNGTTTTPTTGGTTSSPNSEVTDVQPVNATVTASTVNVRSNASTSGNKVAQARQNTVVTINGQATDSEGKTWYRVNFTSDSGEVTGFIRYDFLSVSGEIVPAGSEPPVVDEPVVDDPIVNDPAEDTTPVVTKEYETIKEDGVWWLADYNVGEKYKIDDLFDAAVKNEELYKETQSKVKAQKVWIVILVLLVIALGVVVTLLFLKIKEVTDEAYFSAVEKETIRQRQAAEAKNKNVMHTVGANSKPGTTVKQTTPVKTTVPKMNVPKTTDPAKNTAGTVPQTVKVSNPADTRAAKPVSTAAAAPKPAAKPVQQKPVTQTLQSNEVKKPVESTKQPKNITIDDDDEFEFEFLNWDGEDEN